MKNHKRFAELCAQYAMSLGIEMGGTMAMAAGRIAISVPKRWIRDLCEDQLNEDEFLAIRMDMFGLLREIAKDKGWTGCFLDDRGEDYILQFSLTPGTYRIA